MVLEYDIPGFWSWLFGHEVNGVWQSGVMINWLFWSLLIFAAALAGSWLLGVIFRGPTKGTRVVFGRFWDATRDLVRISPRRVTSLTILSIREAVRRWAWVAFLIYLIVLAFAGFWLDPETNDPSRLYLNFVMSAAGPLVGLIVLFLSVFSIPNDIARRTIYTVVTKPVRASEMILGRIFGFSFVAALLLFAMGIVSYIFVNRAIDHVHAVSGQDFAWGEEKDDDGVWLKLTGRTDNSQEHRHAANIIFKQIGDNAAQNATDITHGHSHNINVIKEELPDPAAEGDALVFSVSGHGLSEGDKILATQSAGGQATSATPRFGLQVDEVVDADTFRINRGLETLEPGACLFESLSFTTDSPNGLLLARDPTYAGEFYFINKQTGEIRNVGVNVGNVWEYRSYLEGGSPNYVHWTFQNVTEENYPIGEYPNGLPLEYTLSVFRTHKADIELGVSGTLKLYNSDTGAYSATSTFIAKEYTTNYYTIPRQVPLAASSATGETANLFEEFVTSDGTLTVELSCQDRGQYFGVAKQDLYIAAANRSFAWNYAKGFLSIFLQILVLCSFGVMFSTFLNGALSLIATSIVMIAGLFSSFIAQLVSPQSPPGGLLFESFYRMLIRAPITTRLDPGPMATMVTALDKVVYHYMNLIHQVLPDLPRLSAIDYVTYGFNISSSVMAMRICTSLGFFIPLFVLSHYILKCREVAK